MREVVVMVTSSYPRYPGDGVGSFMEPIAKGVGVHYAGSQKGARKTAEEIVAAGVDIFRLCFDALPVSLHKRLYVSKLEEGHIHQLTAPGLRSADDMPLLHNIAYYTLNYIPVK